MLIRITSAIAIILLFCGAASAQTKTQRVADYLGSRATQIPAAGCRVQYEFHKGTLLRIADGKNTYIGLLQSAGGYRDTDNAGALDAIYVRKSGTATVELLPSATAPVSSAMPEIDIRPIKNGEAVQRSTWTVSDSLQLANTLNQYKYEYAHYKDFLSSAGMVFWRFFMFMFNAVVFPTLFLLLILLRYISKTAASESAVNVYGRAVIGKWILSAHQNSAALLMVVTWGIMLTILLNSFFSLLPIFPLWLTCVAMIPIGWVAEKITNWIVPNVRVLGMTNR